MDEKVLVSFVAEIFDGSPGDADLNGRFDSGDLLQVFVAGQYEDSIAGNSTRATGDWNCDAKFSSSDLVIALQESTYVRSARVAAAVAAAAVERQSHHRATDTVFARNADKAANDSRADWRSPRGMGRWSDELPADQSREYPAPMRPSIPPDAAAPANVLERAADELAHDLLHDAVAD